MEATSVSAEAASRQTPGDISTAQEWTWFIILCMCTSEKQHTASHSALDHIKLSIRWIIYISRWRVWKKKTARIGLYLLKQQKSLQKGCLLSALAPKHPLKHAINQAVNV